MQDHREVLSIAMLATQTTVAQPVPGSTPPATVGPQTVFRHEFSPSLVLTGQVQSDGQSLCQVTLSWLTGADPAILKTAMQAMPYAVDPRIDAAGQDEVLYHVGLLNAETLPFKTTTRYDGVEYAALNQSEGYFQAFFYNPHNPSAPGGSACG